MAILKPGQTIRTREARISVDGTFRVGRHRFALRVLDADGRASVPDEVVIEVGEGVTQPRLGEPLR